MFTQRQLLRAVPRLTAQLKTPAQRRLASHTPSAGSSTENAFIRERRAVKEHAAGSAGELSTLPLYQKAHQWGLFNCLIGLELTQETELWRKISL